MAWEAQEARGRNVSRHSDVSKLEAAMLSLEAQFVVHVAESGRVFFLTCTTPAMPSNARECPEKSKKIELEDNIT